MMQLSDLWFYFLLVFFFGFVLGWIRRWPVRF
jgi:hypothetical protein